MFGESVFFVGSDQQVHHALVIGGNPTNGLNLIIVGRNPAKHSLLGGIDWHHAVEVIHSVRPMLARLEDAITEENFRAQVAPQRNAIMPKLDVLHDYYFTHDQVLEDDVDVERDKDGIARVTDFYYESDLETKLFRLPEPAPVAAAVPVAPPADPTPAPVPSSTPSSPSPSSAASIKGSTGEPTSPARPAEVPLSTPNPTTAAPTSVGADTGTKPENVAAPTEEKPSEETTK